MRDLEERVPHLPLAGGKKEVYRWWVAQEVAVLDSPTLPPSVYPKQIRQFLPMVHNNNNNNNKFRPCALI